MCFSQLIFFPFQSGLHFQLNEFKWQKRKQKKFFSFKKSCLIELTHSTKFFLCKIHLTWESRFIFFSIFFLIHSSSNARNDCHRCSSGGVMHDAWLFRWWWSDYGIQTQYFFLICFFSCTRDIYIHQKKNVSDMTQVIREMIQKKTLSNIEREREKYNVIFQKHGFRQFMVVVVVVSRSVCRIM